MWNLDNASLPETTKDIQYLSALFTRGTPFNAASAFRVGSSSTDISLATVPNTPVTTTEQGTELYEITVSSSIHNIESVTVGNIALTPAESIDNIKPGEFYHDTIRNKVVVADKANKFIKPDLRSIAIAYKPVTVLTDYVNPSILSSIFYLLPLTGALTINLSLEGHPSSGLSLICNRNTLKKVRDIFIPGNMLKMFDIGFRVASISEKPIKESSPLSREYEVNIALGGKWENYINKPVYLRQSKLFSLSVYVRDVDEPLVSCNDSNNSGGFSTRPPIYNTTSVNALAQRAGATLIGTLLPVKIPSDTPALATASWVSLLDERKRISNYFVDYTKDKAIYCRDISKGAEWSFRDEDLIDYSGISVNAILYDPYYVSPTNLNPPPISFGALPTTIQSPNAPSRLADEKTSIIPFGSDYRNTLLTGEFLERMMGKDTSAKGTTLTSLTFKGGSVPVDTLLKNSLGTTPKSLSLSLSNEDTAGDQNQQPPTWRRRQPNRLVIRQGDRELMVPPEGTLENLFPREHYHLSLNFDSSGPTKTLTISESEDGSPVKEEKYTYGFAFYASQIGGLNEETGELIQPANLKDTWQLVSYEKTTYNYDSVTGYALGSDVTGWRLSRFKQESDDQPESIHIPITLVELYEQLADPQNTADDIESIQIEIDENEAELKAFKFRALPIRSATRYFLKAMASVYPDANQEQLPYETYQVCLPSGKLDTRYLLDPNYVTPMFLKDETSESVTFAFMPAPTTARLKKEREEENESRAEEGLPPLSFIAPSPYVTGEETYMRKSLHIYPKRFITLNNSANTTSALSDRDIYNEYTSDFNSLDAGFKSSLENTRYSEHEGRPGIASRKPPLFEKEEPENEESTSSESKNRNTQAPDIQIRLSSPGFDTYPQTGSIGYAPARTLAEALNAAKADLYFQNVTSTLSSSITVPFNLKYQLWDKVRMICDGCRYNRRIISITHNLEFNGIDTRGIPMVKGTTTLNLGLDREVTFNVLTKIIPKPSAANSANDPSNPGIATPQFPDALPSLGQVLSKNIRSRLNLRWGGES